MKKQILKISVKNLAVILVVLLTMISAQASVQEQILPPVGSEEFGTFVYILPNGNILVTDPLYDAPGLVSNVGAVHLFNGTTLALIGSLTGSDPDDRVSDPGVVVLPNGNYVVRSTRWGTTDVGAVTFCNGTTGCNGTVSAANSLVGGSLLDNIGITGVTVLSDGDYVVRSSNWDKPSPATANVGVVTFCSGTTGCTGLVTETNSLIGGSTTDQVGSGGIVVLPNGNYAVRSPNWDNPAPLVSNVGAVTFCNSTTGCTGSVSDSNSLIGSATNDQISSNGVTVLSDGDFVVRSQNWDNGTINNAGAATFCNGTTGCPTGVVSETNSLVGDRNLDQVASSGVTELANGNYVVISTAWVNPSPPTAGAGAVTFCNGTTGCFGVVDIGNSLVGSRFNDFVGQGGVTALPNGNYVVSSPSWDNGVSMQNAGAATFCGAGGCTGAVSSANSIVGTTPGDSVSSGGIAFLDNSNYAVSSPDWDNGAIADVGMVAFCDDGGIGCIGAPFSVNSAELNSPAQTLRVLTGAQLEDRIRFLTDVSGLQRWDVIGSPEADINGVTDAGIVMRCDDPLGCSGQVTAADGLYGTTPFDRVGTAAALENGKYVVVSPNWSKGAITQVGAVTPCDIGDPNSCKNVAVTETNSLTGSTSGDCIGGSCSISGSANIVFLLDRSKGNYVLASPDWNNSPFSKAGAVTHCSARNDFCAGQVVSPDNSVVGGAANDRLGDFGTITPLSNGNYVIRCTRCDNGGLTDAGAFIHGAGNVGTTGSITPANAIVGSSARTQLTESLAFDPEKGWMVGSFVQPANHTVVNRSNFKSVAQLQQGWTENATWDLNEVPEIIDDVTIITDSEVLLDVIPTVNSVTIQPNGLLTPVGSNFIDSQVEVFFATKGTHRIPVGTKTNGNQASPVDVTVTSLVDTPSLRVTASEKFLSRLSPTQSVKRVWSVDKDGTLRVDITFHWDVLDENGNPALYRVFRSENGEAPIQVSPFFIDTIQRTATVTSIEEFSDWSIGNFAPTAAAVSVGGRVINASGNGIPRAQLMMMSSNGEVRTALTNNFGYFRFNNIAVGEVYVLDVRHKVYQFSPQVVTVKDAIKDLEFVAFPN